jgi:PAS domain S-box-containing protein
MGAGEVPEEFAPAQGRRLGVWLIVLNVAVAALLAALVVLELQRSREGYRERARAAAEDVAASLKEGIAAEIRQVDVSLRTIIGQLARLQSLHPPKRAEIETILGEQQDMLRALDNVRIADAQGVVRYGRGIEDKPPIDVAGRDFFRQVRDDPSAGLVVSEPFITRNTQRWVVVLARRLDAPDGSFGGVVFANLAAEHFQSMFAAVDLGAQSAISLRSTSLRLIARHAPGQPPGPSAGIGTSNVSAELADALKADAQRGFYMSRTALDGIERASAYRKVDGYPMIVLAGLGTEPYFAAWREQAWQLSGLVVATMLIVAGASAWVHAAWQREAAGTRELVAQGHRNQALLRTASDGIHVLDRGGHVIELSESFAQMLGRSRTELLGSHVTSWDVALAPEAIARWLQEFPVGATKRFETRHRRGDGTLIDVEVQSTAARIGADELIYCSARDITERKQLQERAELMSHEQAVMLDNELVGIVRVRERRLVWVNKAVQRIFGYEPDELLGMDMRRFYPDDAAFAAIGATAYPVLHAGGRYRTQQEMIRKDGARVWIDVKGAMIPEGGGDSLWLFHDITPLKQAEEAHVRTVQLQAENRQLQETSRLKSSFLGNMSHELRTPLNAILGFSHLLRVNGASADPARAATYAQQIEASGQRLLRLINAMLMYSQAESERLVFAPATVELPALVQQTVELMVAEAERGYVTLAVELDPRLGRARLDPLRFAQVLSELLSNAIKFTPAGGRVVVRAQPGASDGLRIEVEDTGIGIEQADLARVFTTFQQLSDGHTKRYAGVGIGLALARRLVEAQGGSIGARSEPGVGSVFHVELPGVCRAAEA